MKKLVVLLALVPLLTSCTSISELDAENQRKIKDEIHRTTEIAKINGYDAAKLQELSEFEQIDITGKTIALSSLDHTEPETLAEIQEELSNQVENGLIKDFQIVYGRQYVEIRGGRVLRAVLTVLITKH